MVKRLIHPSLRGTGRAAPADPGPRGGWRWWRRGRGEWPGPPACRPGEGRSGIWIGSNRQMRMAGLGGVWGGFFGSAASEGGSESEMHLTLLGQARGCCATCVSTFRGDHLKAQVRAARLRLESLHMQWRYLERSVSLVTVCTRCQSSKHATFRSGTSNSAAIATSSASRSDGGLGCRNWSKPPFNRRIFRTGVLLISIQLQMCTSRLGTFKSNEKQSGKVWKGSFKHDTV